MPAVMSVVALVGAALLFVLPKFVCSAFNRMMGGRFPSPWPELFGLQFALASAYVLVNSVAAAGFACAFFLRSSAAFVPFALLGVILLVWKANPLNFAVSPGGDPS